MKVKIDLDLCTGCALCTDSVPEVFQMNGDLAEVITPEGPSEQEKAVRDSVSDCPAEAIIIE